MGEVWKVEWGRVTSITHNLPLFSLAPVGWRNRRRFHKFHMVPPSPRITEDACLTALSATALAGASARPLPSPRWGMRAISSFPLLHIPPSSPPTFYDSNIDPQGKCAGVRLTAGWDLKVRNKKKKGEGERGEVFYRSSSSNPQKLVC